MPALKNSVLAQSKQIVIRIDTVWAARHQARYLCSLATTPEADAATLRIAATSLISLPRYLPRSSMPARSCPSHLQVLEVGEPQTDGIHTDFKRFTSPPVITQMISATGNSFIKDPVALSLQEPPPYPVARLAGECTSPTIERRPMHLVGV